MSAVNVAHGTGQAEAMSSFLTQVWEVLQNQVDLGCPIDTRQHRHRFANDLTIAFLCQGKGR